MSQDENTFSATCVFCGKKMGYFNGKITLKDGYVCSDCWNKKGLYKRIDCITESKNYSASQIMDIVNNLSVAKPNNTSKNYAFKCNFCDGGKDHEKIGFSGICSDAIIHNNIIVQNRSWCGHPECSCNDYLLKRITREELDSQDFVCYEAEMLTKWKVQAGVNSLGEARMFKNLTPGKLCVLTTRDPESKKENSRYIFAAFIIGNCNEGDISQSGYMLAMDDYTITFSSKEAHKLLFWDHHKNANAPDKIVWGSGLYRKFDDEEAMEFLDAIVDVKKGTKDQTQAERMREFFVKRNIKSK